jgi:tetratricopeptide (TPR) repeat protein/transcriptional regulator with XRE-family HTH domain
LLRRLRKAKSLTQAQLAAAAEISERAVSNLERGKTSEARPSTVNLLADALGLSGGSRDEFIACAQSGAPAAQQEPAARHGVQRTLLRDIPYFKGRESELDTLTTTAASDSPVEVYAIEGMGGIGKTSLALRAGHKIEDQFPDGQLFLDLHGYTPGVEARSAAAALRSLLHAVGVSDEFIPRDPDECAALYRSRLADTRTLIILDNASSPEQVRPLLPGTPGSLVIITSRRSLAELEGVRAIVLDVLSAEDSAALFRAVAGRDDIAADDHDLAEVVELCGRLPLAIQIVSARLSRRKALTIQEVRDDLRGEINRLARLGDINPKLIAVFETSVRQLPGPERDIFRRLALIPGPDFDAKAAASLAGTSADAARRSLDSLVDHNLLAQHLGDRYRFHDLVRIYARTSDEPVDSAASVRRLLDFYLDSARAADRLFERRIPAADRDPGDAAAASELSVKNAKQAQAWVTVELENLDAAIRYAAGHDYAAHAVALAAALGYYLRGHGPWPMAIAMQERALGIATGTGDLLGQAAALGFLGMMHRQGGALTEAGDCIGRALSLYEETGQPYGQAAMLVELAVIHRLTGKHASATAYLSRSFDLYEQLGSRHGQAGALTELGGLHRQTGDFKESETALTRALDLYREIDNRSGQAGALGYLGSTFLSARKFGQAEGSLKAALNLHIELDDPYNQANNLLMLGGVYRDTENFAQAERLLDEAARIYGKLGERRGQAGVRAYLAALQTRTAEYGKADENLQAAVSLFQALKDPGGEAEALNYWGALAIARDQPELGRKRYEEALRVARAIGSAMDEAIALEGIATACQYQGDTAQAGPHLRQALKIYQSLPSPADAERVRAQLDAPG